MRDTQRQSLSRRRRLLLYGCVAAVFAATFAYRFLDPVLLNDHFEHVSMAMQIVHGRTPGVDFFDPGRPLQEYLSAAGLWLFGHQRLAEVVLCVTFVSIGSALVVLLGFEVSGSVVLGTLAALLVTAIGPRLYAYPKVFIAAVTLLACGRYADVPTRARLVLLGLVTAMAFFFRYDYGLYVGAAVVTTIVSRHWSERRRAVSVLAGYALVVVLLCGPYLAWMAANGAFASGPGTGRLARLLGGEDLVSLQWLTRPLNTEANAAAWLYDVFFVTPFVAAALLVLRTRRADPGGAAREGRSGLGPGADLVRPATSKLLATIVLALFFNVFLIRGNLDSRLPDVAVPVAVLMAWTLSLCVPARRTWSSPRAAVGLAAAAALILSVGLAVDVYAAPATHLARTELLSGPRRTHGHLLAVVNELRGSPLDAYAGAGARGLPALTRYLSRCTAETDHLLVTGYRPEVFFYAGRLFGGGMVAFHANLGAAPREQEVIVERLQREAVPIAVVPVDDLQELEQVYPVVAKYLAARYVIARESGFGEARPVFRVLVDRERQASGVDPELGLPCFAPDQKPERAVSAGKDLR